MAQAKEPKSCFGLFYSQDAEECNQCSIKTICRDVTHGFLSWGVAAAYFAQYTPASPGEAAQRDLLLAHINEQIAKIGRKAVRSVKSAEKNIEFLDPDPKKVLIEAANYFGVDIGFLPKFDVETLEKVIASLYPLPLTKLSIGGKLNLPEEEKLKKTSIHLSFGYGRIIVNYVPATRSISAIYTVPGVSGAFVALKKETVTRHAFEKLAKVKNELIEAQSKVAVSGDAK